MILRLVMSLNGLAVIWVTRKLANGTWSSQRNFLRVKHLKIKLDYSIEEVLLMRNRDHKNGKPKTTAKKDCRLQSVQLC